MTRVKQQILRDEVHYLLDNDFIEPSQSEWSSPCILVLKPDGTFHMCTDYRKVNSVTKTDIFPMPQIDDCIDNIGQDKYVTKFDLLNGFWQILWLEHDHGQTDSRARAQRLSAAHHKDTWSILIEFKYSTARGKQHLPVCKGKGHCKCNVSVLRK